MFYVHLSYLTGVFPQNAYRALTPSKIRGGREKGSILIKALLGKYLSYISYYCELVIAELTYCHGCYYFSLLTGRC